MVSWWMKKGGFTQSPFFQMINLLLTVPQIPHRNRQASRRHLQKNHDIGPLTVNLQHTLLDDLPLLLLVVNSKKGITFPS